MKCADAVFYTILGDLAGGIVTPPSAAPHPWIDDFKSRENIKRRLVAKVISFQVMKATSSFSAITFDSDRLER